MKNRLKSFIEGIRETCYQDDNAIIDNFNSSVTSYSRFQELLNGQEEQLAGQHLRDAGNKLYSTCEWTYKNYLNRRYLELGKNGELNSDEVDTKRAILASKDPRFCNIGYLAKEMKSHANPHLESSGIDLELVGSAARSVNNDPKHNGKIPDPALYLQALEQVRKLIKVYIDESAELKAINDLISGGNNVWAEFIEKCDNFSEYNSYILICGSVQDREKAAALFKIKWDMVIDMDASSDESGLAVLYQKCTDTSPWIRDLTRVESQKDFSDSAISYWIMAGGYKDRPDSLVEENDWKTWKRKYGVNLRFLLEKFHQVYTKNAKVIIFPNFNDRMLEIIVDAFDSCYGANGNLEFFALSVQSTFARIEYDNFYRINITENEFLQNLTKTYKKIPSQNEIKEILIPKEGDTPTVLSPQIYSVASDYFEIIYMGIEERESRFPENVAPENYYKGIMDISWYGLNKHFDVPRSAKNEIVHKIHKNLDEKARVLYSIQYEAGIGGTSFLRRLAWEFHTQCPTLILRRYETDKSCDILNKVYSETKLPILVFADSNNVASVDIEKLYRELRAAGFHFSIYYMQRNTNSVNNRISPMGNLKKLTRTETQDMRDILVKYATARDYSRYLDRICASDQNDDERSPFIMAMYAFDQDFHGIKSYIHEFIKDLNKPAKKILFDIALADYANGKIDVEFFSSSFENDEAESILSINGALDNLVKIYKLGNKQYFKTKYYQFATEILKQLSGSNSDIIEFSKLIDYIIEFIADSRISPYATNHDTIELLRTLFITRYEDSSADKPAFSPIIETLRKEKPEYHIGYDETTDIIVRIFEKLVEIYPEEPHFIGHLARYYFYISKNYRLGFETIDSAISASKSINGIVDPLLYHMKAMGYSSRISDEYIPNIFKCVGLKQDDIIQQTLKAAFEDAEKAFELFELARKDGKGAAGYISEINLCTNIFYMGKRLLNETDYSEFISKEVASPYLFYLDRACSLLEECKKIATDKDKTDVEEVQVRLETYKTGIERNISIWEEYLTRVVDIDRAKIRRMLARAYEIKLNKSDNEDENQRDLQRIIDLMESNIMAEPERPGNIRIWFNAIRHLKTKRPDAVLSDTASKLTRWVALADSPEAHFYRFVIKFLQAYSGSHLAEQELPKLLTAMKEKTGKLYNRTIVLEWLGNSGEGIESLINTQDYRRRNRDEENIQDDLRLLRGRINGRYYVNETHAYISAFGVEVFFNPGSTSGINKTNVNQRVKFGIGFSYDGPRAFNKSVQLLTSEDIDLDQPAKEQSISEGMAVKCEVIEINDNFVNVKIAGEKIRGSISARDGLAQGYSSANRPKIGQIIDAYAIKKGFDTKRQEEVWRLTMSEPELQPWQIKLNEYRDKRV